jgi:hypothetical protein
LKWNSLLLVDWGSNCLRIELFLAQTAEHFENDPLLREEGIIFESDEVRLVFVIFFNVVGGFLLRWAELLV